jgi:CIC family chloride channel protein
MTNSYHLLLPSLLVCSLAFLLSKRWTIYEKQVSTRVDSQAHRGDFFVDLLGSIRVKELMPQVRKVRLVPENMPFTAFRDMFSETDQHYFPVVDANNLLTGIFSINDVRSIIFEREIGDLVVMKDIANPGIIVTTPSEDLNEVLKKFTIRNIQRLPVVKDEDHRILIGMLDRREVIQYYNKRVDEIKLDHQRVHIDSDREITQLKNIPVRLAMRTQVETIPSDMSLKKVTEFVYSSKYNSFAVVDDMERLIGLISLSDCQRLFDGNQEKALTAQDVATRNLVTVTEDDSLFVALTRIVQGDFSFLPVVDKRHPETLRGVISRRDIMSTYDDVVIKGIAKDKEAIFADSEKP